MKPDEKVGRGKKIRFLFVMLLLTELIHQSFTAWWEKDDCGQTLLSEKRAQSHQSHYHLGGNP